jgi:hypothetical protein
MATVTQEPDTSAVIPQTSTPGEPATRSAISLVEKITAILGLCFFLMLWLLLLLDFLFNF